jgi:6-phosphogluconolactonase (cycloisomerase 2 family)
MYVRTLMLIFTQLFAVSLFAQSGFLYTNDESFFGPNTVSALAIQTDGSLTKVGKFQTGGTGNLGNGFSSVRRIIVSPDNRFVFASNEGSNNVSVFAIDKTTGALSLVAGSPFSTGGNGCDGIGLAATPDMSFLFAANSCSANISVFKISSDGSLQLLGAPSSLGANPIDVRVTSNGKFLMASLFSLSGGLIAVLNIGNDGSLTPIAGSPFSDGSPGGGFSTSLETNCASDLLFELNSSGLPQINVFNISATGSLTQIPNSPFTPPGNGVDAIDLSPDEKFLFASNQQNSVSSFSVAPSGALSLVPGTPVASTGTFFLGGLTTDASGQFLYSAGFINSIAAYTVDTQGGLTLHAGSPFHTSSSGGLEALAAFPSKSCAIQVSIEVKPGDPDPPINSQSNGKIPVAILATSTFDPLTQVDTTSLKFGHTGTENSLSFCNANGEDVNGDGLPDLVCHFDTRACGFQLGDTQATLTGKTLTGTTITGTAPVNVIH